MSNVGEKIQLSRDEYRNITRCLENEEFRKLFVQYCEELNDAGNREKYEEELKILEAERGFDVKFIKPLPGYVIKTLVGGKMKAFINVCHCDLIGKPTSRGSVNEKGQKGLKWSIPYAQSQPRKDYDNKNCECVVYDVVFHYDTLHLAKGNANFRKLVTDTAIDAVTHAFNVILDQNLKFPKLQYKGTPKMTVIRNKITNFKAQDEENILNTLSKNSIQDENDNKENITNKVNYDADYVTPLYKLTHRKHVEYHELTNELDAKVNSTVPNELILVIELPLLRSAADCILNITSKILHLISEIPAKYKLEVNLPYEVLEKDGKAKFNIDDKTLTVTLPVAMANRVTLSDIDCLSSTNSGTQNTVAVLSQPAKTVPITSNKRPQVLSNSSRKIIFPKFSANKMDNMFAFTLSVRNVDPASIELRKGVDTVSCKFTNIGSGFFPCYYVFFVRFPNANIAEVHHEEWDNNFILQIVLSESQVHHYFAGPNEDELVQYSIMEDITDKINTFGKEIEDDSLCIAVSKTAAKQERRSNHLSIEIKTGDDTDCEESENNCADGEYKTDLSPEKEHDSYNEESLKNNTFYEEENKSVENTKDAKFEESFEAKKNKKNSRRKNKKRSLSESSCDQLKVIVENEITKLEPCADKSSIINDNSHNCEISETPTLLKQRKARSISESCDSKGICAATYTDSASVDNLTALIHLNNKYKGILKRSSFERSISECSSVDDPSYLATSVDTTSNVGSVEHPNGDLSESCRKTVRFNDLIKTKLFRSNTSILGQKKKNAKKNESKRRALCRRLSEGESTDNDDKDHHVSASDLNAEHDLDSGISLDSDAGICAEKEEDVGSHKLLSMDLPKALMSGQNAASAKAEGGKNAKLPKRTTTKRSDSSDIEYKSDMIFDIEM